MTKSQRIAKAIRQALEVRVGQVLTPELIRERAGNAAHYVLEALEEPTPAGYEPAELETFRAQAAETGQPLTPVEEAELREAIEEAAQCPGCGAANSFQRGPNGIGFCTACHFAFDAQGDDHARR